MIMGHPPVTALAAKAYLVNGLDLEALRTLKGQRKCQGR